MRRISVLLFALFNTMMLWSQEESRLLRFPAVSDSQIVFSQAGDLYSVDRKGGIARKITNDDGYEMFPRFSPDGTKIAFTAQYDGNTEVYVMPAQGGTPKRITYTATLDRDDVADRMGPNNIVMAWTPDGKHIVYRSRKASFNSFVGQLYKVPVDGGMSEELPMVEGGFCSFSSDGKKIAFNKVFREFRTWKYYKGGMADDIRIFDFDTKEIKRISDNVSQDIVPMWIGDEIYYLSDRDRIMNMFCYNTKSGETSKVTNFDKYDIKFPTSYGRMIAFENAGFIYIFDASTKKYEKISIQIADDNLSSRHEMKDASKNITNANISPDGKRVVFSARGDIFSVPAKNGVTYNLSQTSGTHEREAVWSPDGKYIAFFSDKSGEFEIYIRAADGSGEPIQITKNADTYMFAIEWSPDSKKILWNDRKLRLNFVDINTKVTTLVAQTKNRPIHDFNWSPDSKWIVYSDSQANENSKLNIYSLDTRISIVVSDLRFDANSGSFSDDGKYLLFASGRTFNPLYNEVEWNVAYRDLEKIYIVPLLKTTPSPFAPENDVVAVKVDKPEVDPKKKGKTSDKEDKKETKVDVKIDFENIDQRVVEMPIAAANYNNIFCFADKVYYNYSKATGDRGMKMYDLTKKEEVDIAQNTNYSFSTDRKKMLVKQNEIWAVTDVPTAKLNISDKMDLSNMTVTVDLKQEWAQIFYESWRQMRDFFYVENMHGVDWLAMKQKYEVFLPYVQHRNDLTYIIGELIGELNIGHAYVGGGDRPRTVRVKTGLLGAKITKDASGFFKIDDILDGCNWNDTRKNPLQQVAMDVKKGDFIIEINGRSLKNEPDIYALLVGAADKQIELTINSKPTKEGSRKIIVEPIADESELYYYTWIQNNIKKVSQATNNEVGYIHIRDMGPTGLNDFMSNYYSQINKKALIIDDRGNGGGNVSPMLIERLSRQLIRMGFARNATEPGYTPGQMIAGPKVLLVNQYSASDGDLFPYAFKKLKIGKTIGTRSWGGVIGISGSLDFIDGGTLHKPEYGTYSTEASEWIIEGYGVDPDIVVENDPYKEFSGEDTQLNKAIEVINEELKNFKALPAIPVAPDKSK